MNSAIERLRGSFRYCFSQEHEILCPCAACTALKSSRQALPVLYILRWPSASQLAAVCSKFRQATLLVPALRLGLTSSIDPPRDLRLDSAFALQWARRVCSLDIRPKVLRLQGLTRFVAAAEHVTEVNLMCTSMPEAAQAGLLLAQCSTVTVLSLSGTYMPAVLPSSVKELKASFSPPGNSTQPDELICYAALLPQLSKLELQLSTTVPPAVVSLQAPVQLPVLQSLVISKILLSSPSIDLKWVQQQPCNGLGLDILANTSDVARHAAVIEQLSQMTLHRLWLDMKVPFTSELQALWGGLETVYLELVLWVPTSDPLQILPRCSELHWGYDSQDEGPAYVSWAALTSRAARIVLHTDGELHVVGAGRSAPYHLHEPWQLEVANASAVYGLPASQPAGDCKYFLQNAAARAAGWTYDMEWS